MSIKFKKRIIWGFVLLVFILFLVNINFNSENKKTEPRLTVVTKTEERKEVYEPNIKLAFVGDMMLGRGVKNSVYKNFSGDYEQLFIKVKQTLLDYDLLFVNLEGPISDKGDDVGGLYSFRFEPVTISVLKEVGFDIISLANNHTFNWGEVALLDTIKLLSNTGMSYIGAGFDGLDAYQDKILNIKGTKISFLAFSEFKAGGTMSSSTNPGLALISEENVIRGVSRAKNNSDLVIVSFHFGEEYTDLPNDYQKKYAKLAIDSGADLIVGHHPHVIQTLEQYKNVYIIYSLGNFIFDQYFSEETMQGGLLEVEVNPKNKKIQNINLRKVFLNKYFQIESIE
jgi:poly-gamma-glutamate synthesis protein (capsule biosynthesis protein)